MKNQSTRASRGKTSSDARGLEMEVDINRYWVLVWDETIARSKPIVVEAADHEEAESKAVSERNVQNGGQPGEDDGFIAVASYDETELRQIISKLSRA